MSGQLTIKAPNTETPYVDESNLSEDRITYLLYDEIDHSLAAHADEVSHIELITG